MQHPFEHWNWTHSDQQSADPALVFVPCINEDCEGSLQLTILSSDLFPHHYLHYTMNRAATVYKSFGMWWGNNDVSWTLGSLNKLVGLIRPLDLKRWAYSSPLC